MGSRLFIASSSLLGVDRASSSSTVSRTSSPPLPSSRFVGLVSGRFVNEKLCVNVALSLFDFESLNC